MGGVDSEVEMASAYISSSALVRIHLHAVNVYPDSLVLRLFCALVKKIERHHHGHTRPKKAYGSLHRHRNLNSHQQRRPVVNVIPPFSTFDLSRNTFKRLQSTLKLLLKLDTLLQLNTVIQNSKTCGTRIRWIKRLAPPTSTLP